MGRGSSEGLPLLGEEWCDVVQLDENLTGLSIRSGVGMLSYAVASAGLTRSLGTGTKREVDLDHKIVTSLE